MWGLVLVQMIEVRSDADLRTTPEPRMQHFPFGLVNPPGWGLGLSGWGLGSWVWGSGFQVESSGVQGSGFIVQG